MGRTKGSTAALLVDRLIRRLQWEGDCWVWVGYTMPKGYGVIGNGHGKQKLTHRVAYELFVKPIPEGKIVMHTCDNPPCCNPKHLQLGSIAENQTDMAKKGRSRRKFTDSDIYAIRARIENIKKHPPTWTRRAGTDSYRQISRDYGVDKNVIFQIRDGKTYCFSS